MKKNRAKEYYDRLAGTYDRATTQDKNAWTAPKLVNDIALKYCNKKSDILDIGIGTGQSIEAIHNSNLFHKIVGVDISKNMLAVCHKKFPKIDLLEIPSLKGLRKFDSASFDIIICCGVFEFFENPKLFFTESQRLLRNKGILIFTYEPLILFHRYQNKSKSAIESSTKSHPLLKDFNTYRHTPTTIQKHLVSSNLELISDLEFISYKKGDTDIVYHLVTATNKEPD